MPLKTDGMRPMKDRSKGSLIALTYLQQPNDDGNTNDDSLPKLVLVFASVGNRILIRVFHALIHVI